MIDMCYDGNIAYASSSLDGVDGIVVGAGRRCSVFIVVNGSSRRRKITCDERVTVQ